MSKNQTVSYTDVQKYLEEWNKYQNKWIASPGFDPNQPLLLPISVDILKGEIERSRLKSKHVTKLLQSGGNNLPSAINVKGKDYSLNDIHAHYFQEGFPEDSNESGGISTHPTPLDFNIRTKVLFLFHLPRPNWTFTDDVQFSVKAGSGLPVDSGDLVDVLGTFDNGHGLAVYNKFWIPKGHTSYNMEYNLHITIAQTEDHKPMETQIIIDPGQNSDNGPPP